MGSFNPSECEFNFNSSKPTSPYQHIIVASFLFDDIFSFSDLLVDFTVDISPLSSLQLVKAFFTSYFFFYEVPNSSSVKYRKPLCSMCGTFVIYFCSYFGLDLHSGVHFKFLLQKFLDKRFCDVIALMIFNLAYYLLMI